jgi:phosphoglucomutase
VASGAPLVQARGIEGCFRRGSEASSRPSGTESLIKIYAESFQSQEHLETILKQAQDLPARIIGYTWAAG